MELRGFRRGCDCDAGARLVGAQGAQVECENGGRWELAMKSMCRSWDRGQASEEMSAEVARRRLE